MIMNERQYRVSRAKAERLRKSLSEIEAEVLAGRASCVSKFARAEIEGLRSLLDDLKSEIAEYDALRAGGTVLIDVESVVTLPIRLIKARIASGLSQRELGERLGVAEQQIQRYESTSYATASFSRLVEIAEVLDDVRRRSA